MFLIIFIYLLLVSLAISTIGTIKNLLLLRFKPICFKDKTIWITGASSGIGEALSIRLSNLGANLILSSRRTDALELVRQKCNPLSKIDIVAMDLGDPYKAKEIVSNYLKNQADQAINILIHNAGVSQRSKFLDFSYQNHEYMTNLNYNTPFAITQLIAQHMINYNPRNIRNGSQIVIISSVAGKLNPGLRSTYGSTKAALSSLFDSIRIEMREYGLKVTQIFPGYIKSYGSKNALIDQPGQVLGSADDNLKSSMEMDQFIDQAITAIYLEVSEKIISKNLKDHFGEIVKLLTPQIYQKLVYDHYKKSIGWVKEAKNINKK